MYDNDQSDSDSMLHPALPVGHLCAGKAPQDGLQYLSIVHRQAREIPDVISVDRSKFAQPRNTSEPASTNSVSALNGLSDHFINKQLQNFSQTRQYCCRMQKIHSKRVSKDAKISKSKKLFDDAPSLSLILALAQTSVFNLLEYVEEVCLSPEEESRVPNSVTSWMFALLAVVDKPVPMDYMAILR